jgi:hypothetical protein
LAGTPIAAHIMVAQHSLERHPSLQQFPVRTLEVAAHQGDIAIVVNVVAAQQHQLNGALAMSLGHLNRHGSLGGITAATVGHGEQSQALAC